MSSSSLGRRALLTTTAAAGGLTVLAACSSLPTYGQGAAPAPASPVPTGGTPYRVGKLSDVAVGQSAAGKANGKDILIFRAAETSVLAYSAVCTHAACAVSAAGSTLTCPCHGSTFKAADGTVITGPARRPLVRYPAAIDGEWITVSV